MELFLNVFINMITGRKLRLMLMVLIGLSFALPVQVSIWVTPAEAQVKKPKKRTNVFNLLFGKRGSLKKQFKRTKAKRIKLRKKKNRRRTVAAPVAVVSKKNKDALKIIVAGDFMADGLAWGLAQTFADNPAVSIVDLSKGLSGFVREDVKNWPKSIGAHIDKIKPAAVVFLAGMNDRQQMSIRGRKYNKLSKPWLEAYNTRTKNLAQAVQKKNVHFVWVGLPPVKSSKMSADYLVFNEIYRTHAESVSGAFVNVWDGFTNQEGQFVSAGPDINGQIKRLRRSDGINMNRTGQRKLAFYVAKAIRKLTGIGTDKLIAALPSIETPKAVSPEYDPVNTGKTIVYSLVSPALDGSARLADHQSTTKVKESNPGVVQELVKEGVTPKTQVGRIDHYGVKTNEARWFLAETPSDIVEQDIRFEVDATKPVKSTVPSS